VNGNSFIKEIGRSYIVSSFLPAALFVSMGVFIFRGFAPKFLISGIQQANSFLGLSQQGSFSLSSWFFVFTLTSWIAFCLYSSTNWTIQLYEGYKFHPLICEIMKFSLRTFWHKKQIEIYEANRAEFEKNATIWNDELIISRKMALDEIADVEGYAPIDEEDLMPTRLGNVLRASELYADERYKLNSLVIFPKLIHILPTHFVNELEDKNNRFIFLIHSSLLSYIVGILSLIAVLVNKATAPLCGTGPSTNLVSGLLCKGFITRGFTVLSPNEYFVAGLFFFAVGYFIYRISIVAAREFALHIRAGFDLYRFDLLRQLNHQLPKNLHEEMVMWELLSEYFVAGNRLRFAELRVQYEYHEKPKSDHLKE
jgi:hypothetical protein